MSVDYTTKPENVLKLRQIVPGLLRLLARAPSLARVIKKLLTSKMTDNSSIGSLIEENAKKYPDRPALLYRDERLTHDQFNRAANRLANLFIKRGVKKGDVVVVMLDNRPEILTTIVAMAKIGAIASLINVNQRGKVLLHSIGVGRDNVFIVGEESVEAFDEVRPQLELSGDDEVYFVPDGSDTAAPDGYLDLTAMTAESSENNPPTTSGITLADPFTYVFTSGTTGLPKAGVINNFRWMQASRWFGRFTIDVTEDDIFYVPLPFYHTMAFVAAWGVAAQNGSAMALSRKFSASIFWEETRKFNATVIVYIGELCRYLINKTPHENDRNNPVQKMFGLGLRPDIWKQFKERFDIPYVYEVYSASESTLAFTNMFNLDCTVGFCGAPYAIVKYDFDQDRPVTDDEGCMQKVGPGEVGLLLGKITDFSPFSGYTDKKATEKKIFQNVFEDGDSWFNTGDLMRNIGLRHAQFVDRLGDTFRWKGENVSTTEVEEAVNTIAGIAASTVYGVEIPGTNGRAGMVSIVTNTLKDDIDKSALARALKNLLPPYAVPIFLRLKTGFDTTHTYKIKKIDLKKEGYDPETITDPLYIILPGENEYRELNAEVYKDVASGKYRF